MIPSSDLVAVAWLRLALPGFGVATTLPADATPLRTDGFVRVLTVGGTPETYVPLRRPVVAAECWAAPATQASSKPPWGRSANLAELLVAATYNRALMDVTLDLSSQGDYSPAHVRTVIALSEPRRIENDPANYARFDLDLAFTWATA